MKIKMARLLGLADRLDSIADTAARPGEMDALRDVADSLREIAS